MIVEWYALKSFALGGFIIGFLVSVYFKYRYECKHFEIEGLNPIKKPKA